MTSTVTMLDGRVTLHPGDCMAVLPTLEPDSVDSVVTDPPYHLTSIVKRFGAENAAPAKVGKTGAYARASAGFMGKQWDGGDIAFQPETWAAVLRVLKPGGHLVAFGAPKNAHRLTCAIEDAGFEIRDCLMWIFGSGFPKSLNVGNGFGTALKPAYEPVILVRKPLSESTIAGNVLRWGTGALNIDATRIGTGGDKGVWPITERRHADVAYTLQPIETDPTKGRWPANLIHDNSEEVLAGFPETEGRRAAVGPQHGPKSSVSTYGDYGPREQFEPRGDSGSAARFFYTAKADADDRLGSKHPTVKPIDLMRWLVRLITPPGGTVLDPFAGTGTTAEAAYYEGFNAILIEREAEYQADIKRRMALVLAGPDERIYASAKAKHGDKPADHGPLFAEPS